MADIPEILDIEAHCGDGWGDEMIRGHRRGTGSHHVAVYSERVVGHVIYAHHKDSYTLERIAVHPRFRRKEIGSQMIDRVTRVLSPTRRHKVVCDVSDRNTEAHLFLSSQSFVGSFHARGDSEDVYRFTFRIKKAGEIVSD
jgi:ribosomal protein S18 acetylase RimI-like enzyme